MREQGGDEAAGAGGGDSPTGGETEEAGGDRIGRQPLGFSEARADENGGENQIGLEGVVDEVGVELLPISPAARESRWRPGESGGTAAPLGTREPARA